MRHPKYARISTENYLAENAQLYKDSKENKDKLILIFPKAIVHLEVQHIWDEVTSHQNSQKDIHC